MSLALVVLTVIMVPGVLAGNAPRQVSLDATIASAHEEAGAAQEDAQSKAEATRIQAEDHALSVYRLGMDSASIAWGYAEDTAASAWGRVTRLLGDSMEAVFSSKKAQNDSGVTSQSSQTIVRPGSVEASLLLLAASTGATILLLWLGRKLLTLAGLPLLSRIAHSDIYENEARRTVSQLVVGEPGLCLNDIVSRTGFSRNAVSYHLFVLEKEEEIVSVKDGKYRRYFTRNGKYVNGAKDVVAALRNETTLRLAQVVAQRPGAIQRELCIELGATPSATCWHAKRLLELGVIRKERVSNTVQYFPGEALAKYDLADFGLPGRSSAQALPAPRA